MMTNEFRPWGMEKRTFLLLMHLSQLCNFIIPFGGIIAPLIMWQTNKNESQEIDEHGKIIMNWVLSSVIYAVICAITMVLVIGFVGFVVLGIASLVFIVIGAIKANDGIVWPYPLSIQFFK